MQAPATNQARPCTRDNALGGIAEPAPDRRPQILRPSRSASSCRRRDEPDEQYHCWPTSSRAGRSRPAHELTPLDASDRRSPAPPPIGLQAAGPRSEPRRARQLSSGRTGRPRTKEVGQQWYCLVGSIPASATLPRLRARWSEIGGVDPAQVEPCAPSALSDRTLWCGRSTAISAPRRPSGAGPRPARHEGLFRYHLPVTCAHDALAALDLLPGVRERASSRAAPAPAEPPVSATSIARRRRRPRCGGRRSGARRLERFLAEGSVSKKPR